MFKSWKFRLCLALLWSALVMGSNPFNPSNLMAEEILAEVGGLKLSKEDVQTVLETDPQLKEIIKQKPELKGQVERLVIDRWLNISLLYLFAKEKGLDKVPSVQKKMVEMEKYLLAEEVLQRNIPKTTPAVEELKSYYEKNKELYSEPEGIKVKHILVYIPENADKQTKTKALNKAKQIKNELGKGAKFEDLARKYSDDTASREKGGDLGILRKGLTVPEFEKSVFALKEGQISDPILSPYGYHLVKVEKKIPPRLKSFEEVKTQVENDYLKEKERETLAKLMEDLRKKYQPKVHYGIKQESNSK